MTNIPEVEIDDLPSILDTGKPSEPPALRSTGAEAVQSNGNTHVDEDIAFPSVDRNTMTIQHPDKPVIVIGFPATVVYGAVKNRINTIITQAENNFTNGELQGYHEKSSELFQYTTERKASPISLNRLQEMSSSQKRALLDLLTSDEYVRIRMPVKIGNNILTMPYQERPDIGLPSDTRDGYFVVDILTKQDKETKKLEMKIGLGTPQLLSKKNEDGSYRTMADIYANQRVVLQSKNPIITISREVENIAEELCETYPEYKTFSVDRQQIEEAYAIIGALFEIPSKDAEVSQQTPPFIHPIADICIDKYIEYQRSQPALAAIYKRTAAAIMNCNNTTWPLDGIDPLDLLQLRADGLPVILPFDNS